MNDKTFVLVTDQNERRIKARGYEKFLLGPVTDIDGDTAEDNTKFLTDLVASIGDYEVQTLTADEVQESYSETPRSAVMTPDEIDTAFDVLGPGNFRRPRN